MQGGLRCRDEILCQLQRLTKKLGIESEPWLVAVEPNRHGHGAGCIELDAQRPDSSAEQAALEV